MSAIYQKDTVSLTEGRVMDGITDAGTGTDIFSIIYCRLKCGYFFES